MAGLSRRPLASLLQALHAAGALTTAQLAARLGLEPEELAPMLRQLAAMGLLQAPAPLAAGCPQGRGACGSCPLAAACSPGDSRAPAEAGRGRAWRLTDRARRLAGARPARAEPLALATPGR